MGSKLERFCIKNLYGYKSFDVEIEDNKLILVGENGSSKSTIVSMFYYFLTKQWKKLREFEFEEMSIVVDSKEFKVSRQELLSTAKNRYKTIQYILERLKELNVTPEDARRNLTPELARKILNGPSAPIRMPYSALNNILNEIVQDQHHLFLQEADNLTDIEKYIDFRILYLPTYRRIERDLKIIFPALEEEIERYNRNNKVDNDKKHIELVEFGMEDVMALIGSTMSSLNNWFRTSLNSLTGGYLRVVLRKEYKSADLEALKTFPPELLGSIMSRIDESILSKDDRKTLLKTIEELKNKETATEIDLISAHIISEIILLHKKQYEREENVRTFANVCNKYLRGKEFVFDNDHFTLPIKPIMDFSSLLLVNKSDEIKLSMLSSGEKQIVSLFAHLYLTGNNNYILIIDEPELSLSVPWQQTLLPDILKTGRCNSLIAVTHSPFIYKNELADKAHSIEEFVSE